MDWLESHGLTLGLLLTLVVHWTRMEIRFAVLARDMQWIRGQLDKWGLLGPSGK